jgi:hypothetical protein
MTIILSFSDTASLSSVMNCCTTVGTFSVLLVELGACTEDLFTELPVVADAATQGATWFSHMSAVIVVVGVVCLDAVQLQRTAFVS